jgi:exosortase/archaeosortase family protein
VPDRSLVPFTLVMGVLTLFVLLGPHEPVRAGPLGWLDHRTAAAVADLGRAAGWPVSAAGPLVAHPGGFTMEVYYRCTGLLPVLFLAGAVLTLPEAPGRKLAGLLVGTAVVLAVNLARLVAILYVGVRAPRFLGPAHEVVGECAIVLTVFACWWAWLRWCRRGRGERTA